MTGPAPLAAGDAVYRVIRNAAGIETHRALCDVDTATPRFVSIDFEDELYVRLDGAWRRVPHPSFPSSLDLLDVTLELDGLNPIGDTTRRVVARLERLLP